MIELCDKCGAELETGGFACRERDVYHRFTLVSCINSVECRASTRILCDKCAAKLNDFMKSKE